MVELYNQCQTSSSVKLKQNLPDSMNRVESKVFDHSLSPHDISLAEKRGTCMMTPSPSHEATTTTKMTCNLWVFIPTSYLIDRYDVEQWNIAAHCVLRPFYIDS